MTRCALWLVLGALSCSSDDPTIEETHDFVDAAERQCQATLERTSEGSPVVFSSVSCSGAGRECSSESSPCFQLSIAPRSIELRNCAACCKGSSSSFVDGDCSAVVCEGNADCVYPNAECEAGVCTCPNGSCD